MLPHDPTISYEGHLSGAIVGVLLALYYRKLEPIESLRNEERIEEEDVLWDDWKHPFDRELDHKKSAQQVVYSRYRDEARSFSTKTARAQMNWLSAGRYCGKHFRR